MKMPSTWPRVQAAMLSKYSLILTPVPFVKDSTPVLFFSCDMLGELGSILTVSFQIYQECVSILSPLTRELGGGNFQGQAALDSRNGAVFLPHGSSSGS